METRDFYKNLSREKLEALAEILEKIGKVEFEEMLNFLVKKTVEILNIERCCVFRVFPETETFCLVTGEPKDGHGVGKTFYFSNLESLKEAVETKSQVYVPNARDDKRTEESRGVILDKDINSLLITPLMAGDEVIGLIVADGSRAKIDFTKEEKDICLILGNSASLLLERDLLQKQKEEKKSLVTLGRAADECAHKMRNPLATIGGYARRLAKEIQNSEHKNYAERIIREADKSMSDLDKLLRFSRSKKQKIVSTDINEIIKEVEQTTRSLIKEKKIEIELKLNGEIPLISIDPAEIRDVFLEILRNAVEAIDREGNIFIQTKKEDKYIRISFANNGGCIDEEIIDHIFDPFFTTKSGSIGLGLAFVGDTVRAYGGELKVENDTQAKQATFFLRMPYSQNI